jgi:CubicO group peptidase (beta-lactamase class C family)
VNRRAVARAVDEHLERRPSPAAAVAVVDADGPVLQRIVGTADLTTGEQATAAHWWDLASLTKHLVTTPAVADLVAEGRVDLERPLGEQWPRVAGLDIGEATVPALLAYDAGMPASVRYYLEPAPDRATLVDRALRTRRERPMGGDPVYSDLGFLALGELVAAIGPGLEAAAARRGWARYGRPPGPAVAYEDDPWRGHLVKGEVHDENTAALGGIAGHAGGFATLDMVVAAARSLLVGGVYPADFPATATWSAAPDRDERFGLGWYLGRTRGIGGSDPPDGAFGATGFVGNCLWIEPPGGFAVVLLANRVHPHRPHRAPFRTWVSTLIDTIRSTTPDNPR